MILVLLGTNPYSFKRLVRAVDILARDKQENIFIQLGNTNYSPSYCKYKRFLEKEKLLDLIKKAELIITHGGFGSILDCLKEGKRVVAVPRCPEFKESVDRQVELVKQLESEGRLIGVYDIQKLPEAIKIAKATSFSTESPNNISGLIIDFIERTTKCMPHR